MIGTSQSHSQVPLGFVTLCYSFYAGWSSLVARWAHNPKVGGSNPPPATNAIIELRAIGHSQQLSKTVQ